MSLFHRLQHGIRSFQYSVPCLHSAADGLPEAFGNSTSCRHVQPVHSRNSTMRIRTADRSPGFNASPSLLVSAAIAEKASRRGIDAVLRKFIDCATGLPVSNRRRIAGKQTKVPAPRHFSAILWRREGEWDCFDGTASALDGGYPQDQPNCRLSRADLQCGSASLRGRYRRRGRDRRKPCSPQIAIGTPVRAAFLQKIFLTIILIK